MLRSTRMNKTSIHVSAVVFALSATMASSTFGQEPDPTDAASVALIETVANSLGVLVDTFGCNTQALINYNGSDNARGRMDGAGPGAVGRYNTGAELLLEIR